MAITFHHFLPLFLVAACHGVRGYVPASATNDTTVIQQAMNATGASKLHMQWYANGSYWENVSYQLVAANSTGISQGALVHFSEKNVTNMTLPTLTPWIALVSCDYNATNASQDEDIFTLARDRGAVSALLYSYFSKACIINSAYQDPSVFNQILDIFSTQSLTSSHLIDYQFGQSGTSNTSVYDYYNSQLLNQSFNDVNDSINTGSPVAQGYLIATLQAYNATMSSTPNSGGEQGGASTQSNSSSNTGLAMIILYAITGCVSALFCVVIISGAIRAIRHPDRYGPRVAVHHGGGGGIAGQSRARGITRAILDTFPIVKFGNNETEEPAKDPEEPSSSSAANALDSQPSTSAMELRGLEADDAGNSGETGEQTTHSATAAAMAVRSSGESERKNDQDDLPRGSSDSKQSGHENKRRSTNSVAVTPRLRGGKDVGEGPSRRPPEVDKDIVPDAIGRETCPICIVDFEEGDDLRLLPCEGKHRFHQHCVDPWLLELSSSCPICRQDFLALETMLSGESDEGGHWHTPDTRRLSGIASQGNRFSRYLRSARRRNRAQEENEATTDRRLSPEADV